MSGELGAPQYDPTPELAAAVADAIALGDGGGTAVESLPNEPLHALIHYEPGSITCAEFLFFEVMPGRQSELATDPPASIDGGPTGDKRQHRLECYSSVGHLARIDGRPAFAVADYDPTGFGSDVQVTTFGNGRWSSGCRTTVDFETVYKADKTTAEIDSQLSPAELAQLAPALALALDRDENGKSSFKFGPTIPSALDEQVTRAEAEATASRLGDPKPIYLQGRLYLVVADHPAIGWRVDTGIYLIDFYAADGQSLKHAAHTEVTANRGRLSSVRVDALQDK